MASLNSALLLVLFVAISAFTEAPSGVEAQLLMDLITVIGTAACPVNETVPEGPASPLANAKVDLQCRNSTVAETRTDVFGRFNITVRPVDEVSKLNMLLFMRRGDYRVTVANSSFLRCLANLPVAGSILVANLSPGVSTILNGVNVYGFVAGDFSWVNI